MSDSSRHCGNCEALLTGPFCAQCGQSAHESARSLQALFHDGWHTLTHLDGRLWRSLWLLLVRPGEMSRQFVANHRVRFLPPFRLYLVISLVFFGLLGVSHHEVDGTGPTVEAEDSTCTDIRVEWPWLADRMHTACMKVVADHGASLVSVFLRSLPRAMFLFLPLLAAGMLLLYWRPRRYYVEHLVLFLHNHSAAFLLGITLLLVQMLERVWPAFETVSAALEIALFFWFVVYLYLAMRRFYGQGRRRTLCKMLVIGFFYLVTLTLMVVLTLLYSALTM